MSTTVNASAAPWSPFGPPPAGIRVDNMRRRGVDFLCIHVPGPKLSRNLAQALLLAALLAITYGVYYRHAGLGFAISCTLLAGSWLLQRHVRASTWDIRVSPNLLTVISGGDERQASKTTHLTFTDIEGIATTGARLGKKCALRIASHDGAVTVGEGLPAAKLEWIKNTLIMEVTGLTWKPLHSVARRHSRQRSSLIANPLLLKPDLALRLIAIFLEEAPQVVRRLGEAVAAKDAVAIRRHAHWLKSASANVGARQLSELCQRMQLHAMEKDLSRTEVLFREIDRKHADAISWLGDIRDTAAIRIGQAMPEDWSQPRSAEPAEAPAGAAAASAGGAAAPGPAGGLIDASVLVVDDSKVSREVAREFLSEIVPEPVFAEDGGAALELWERHSFDLILMDCEMHGMDGYECARRIRLKESVRPGRRTPIIALTGHALTGDRDRCLAAGMDDYLSKPYAPEDLHEVVMRWLLPSEHRPEPEPRSEPPAAQEADASAAERATDQAEAVPAGPVSAEAMPAAPAPSAAAAADAEMACLDAAGLPPLPAPVAAALREPA